MHLKEAEKFGSSPLARGTLPPLDNAVNCVRLIPARAGNTRLAAASAAFIQSLDGSSPLARGTPSAARDQAVAIRLIPARAGNTSMKAVPTVSSTAHPRSRGEHA